MKKILPLIFLLLGAGAGMGAGLFLRPPPPEIEVADEGEDTEKETKVAKTEEKPNAQVEYVKLNNQFIIPVVEGDDVSALVVMSLSLEVEAGMKEAVYAREPKIRDSFLRVLFDYSNVGGFRGAFTDGNTLEVLRNGLREVAQKDMGGGVTDVLILEIGRQDY